MIGVTNWTKIFPSCKPHFLHYLMIANGPRQWAYSTRWHLQYLNWRPCRLVWVHIFRIWSRSIQCTCNLQMESMWPVTYINRPSSPFFFFFRNRERSSSLYIKRCTQLFLLQGSEYLNYYNHESAKVETWINHQNKSSNKKLSIPESTSMKPGNRSFMRTVNSRLHPVTISSRWSSGRSRDHDCIQCAASRITYKKLVPFCLSNTIVFWQFQMDQHKAQTPIRILALWYVSNVSIIFHAPCLFLHHLLSVSLHFMAFLCIFWN
jgi:hypothetical protein